MNAPPGHFRPHTHHPEGAPQLANAHAQEQITLPTAATRPLQKAQHGVQHEALSNSGASAPYTPHSTTRGCACLRHEPEPKWLAQGCTPTLYVYCIALYQAWNRLCDRPHGTRPSPSPVQDSKKRRLGPYTTKPAAEMNYFTREQDRCNPPRHKHGHLQPPGKYSIFVVPPLARLTARTALT